MKYTLMHKEISVCDITIDSKNQISKINEIHNANHLPVGTGVWRNNQPNKSTLNEWWTDRSIPTSRSGVRQALETLNLSDTKMLLTKCFGLSLSDHYWIRPFERTDIAWKDINFFNNPFSEDIGDILLGKAVEKDNFDFSSPDNTSDGCLKKRWKIIDGKRCLIKGGSGIRQQPFNEKIATIVMQRLNIPHIPYDVIFVDDEPYSVCENFVTTDNELIPAWRMLKLANKPNDVSFYQHFVNCCNSVGVKNVELFLDQMIVLDYIILNEDRHFNNFGLLRDPETLEYVSFAPMYDNGTSLGYDTPTTLINRNRHINCKPFKTSFDEQLKLVTSFDWIDFDKLDDEMINEISDVFNRSNGFVDEYRANLIINGIQKRIANIRKLSYENAPKTDNIEYDLSENIAEDYLEI